MFSNAVVGGKVVKVGRRKTDAKGRDERSVARLGDDVYDTDYLLGSTPDGIRIL